MSKDFLNRQNSYFTNNPYDDEPQHKIDPVAQLKELKDNRVRYWGIFGELPPIQYQSAENVTDIDSQTNSQTEPETESETESDVYIITDSEAIIRSDTEPHDEKTGNKIPLGTKVIIIDSYNEKTRVQYVNNADTKYWTSTSNIDIITPVNDNNLYTAFYNDIIVYSNPEGEKKEDKLEVNKKYFVLNKCETAKNKFYEIKKEGSENPVGWIIDYEYVLYDKNSIDREDKLSKFKDWLKERLTEAQAKTGDDKIKFVQGILGLIEKESAKIAKNPPEFPNLETLDKNPTYSETNNPDLNTYVPHELISITRSFINITEFTPEINEDTESEEVETVIGGSRYSKIDWNSRLGVPQYRTQSDNLSIPEATCNVTTMAMTLERLGNSRQDVINAIETKLKNGEEKTDEQLKTLWEEKSKVYLEKITSDTDKDYKKIRAGSSTIGSSGGDLIGKEGDISKKFKEIAQMEDLLDFYLYLKTSSLSNRYSIFDTYKDSIPEDIEPSVEDKYATEKINLGKNKLSTKQRHKIKTILDGGGAVVLSVNHKGTEGSHILNVQSINSDGIIVDDPYGKHAQDYRFGETGDLFAGKNKSNSDRESAGYKNVVHDKVSETDYTKRDFTVEAGQNLEDDELRGNSILLKYEMINDSKASSGNNFIYYLVLYEKK